MEIVASLWFLLKGTLRRFWIWAPSLLFDPFDLYNSIVKPNLPERVSLDVNMPSEFAFYAFLGLLIWAGILTYHEERKSNLKLSARLAPLLKLEFKNDDAFFLNTKCYRNHEGLFSFTYEPRFAIINPPDRGETVEGIVAEIAEIVDKNNKKIFHDLKIWFHNEAYHAPEMLNPGSQKWASFFGYTKYLKFPERDTFFVIYVNKSGDRWVRADLKISERYIAKIRITAYGSICIFADFVLGIKDDQFYFHLNRIYDATNS